LLAVAEDEEGTTTAAPFLLPIILAVPLDLLFASVLLPTLEPLLAIDEIEALLPNLRRSLRCRN
jgi:hypothetical protein